MIKSISSAAVALAVLTGSPVSAAAEAASAPVAGATDTAGASTAVIKRLIASSSHRENGCSESTAPFKVAIPDYERLDKNYQGKFLTGIDVVEREHNGTASAGNFAFVDDGAAVIYTLSARGGGSRIRFFTTNVCQGASGANIAIEVYAVYRAAENAKQAASAPR